MIHDKVIYTDGHDVTVTSSDFKVRNTMYKLNGIIKHSLSKVRANRIPGVILFILGGIMLKLALMDFFPSDFNLQVGDKLILSNVLAAWTGVAIALIGTVWILAVRERYAVRISTAEGEKNVVVSRRREYVAQIVDALNEAYDQIDFRSPYKHDRIEIA